MTADHILLLAGTHEARQLARRIAERFPAARLTASFAGAVSDLPDLGVETRVGGFGGVQGLTSYLEAEAVSVLVDATHPFAVQMSRHAAEAAALADTPLIRLDRPPWTAEAGDHWQGAATLEDAAALLPAGARAFLSVGRKDISLFSHRTDLFALVRMIEPPAIPLPEGWMLILSRPPQSVDEEAALMETHRISHLVTKNSGGSRARAKILAARRLSLPVLMVARPELGGGIVSPSVDALLATLGTYVG